MALTNLDNERGNLLSTINELTKPINDLPAASALTGAELVRVEQGGNSRKAFASSLIGRDVDDVSALLADTVLTYTAAQAGTVAAGDIIRTRAEGFSYEVAASAATDQHVTTEGGVKLYWVSSSQRWNLVARPASVSLALGGAGALTGQRFWSVSYVTAEGETDISIGVAATPTDQSVNVTIPVSSDRRVIARRIYRTVSGETESQRAFLVAEIADNTTTVYNDNIADGSLGTPAKAVNLSGGKLLNGSSVLASLSGLSTAFGFSALSTGQGYAVTAFGAQALENNTTGYRNTAVGTNALDANTTGFNNTGVGVHALNDNTTGNDNTALGVNALFFYNGGLSTTAVGANAGANITSGNFNTFLGGGAGQLRTGGAGNTFVGYNSGYAAGNGAQNAALGQIALEDLTTGDFNLGIGYGAGQNITTGSFNTALGWGALTANLTGGNNIAIGPRAGNHETGNSKLWIDSQDRADLATAEATSIIVGTMGATRAAQQLNVNGQINPLAGLGMPGREITADATVTVDDTVLTCNKSGSTLVLTLPTGKPDKILILRNQQAQLVDSATANIQPIGGGADAVSILPATVGAWAMIRCRSTGSAWEIIARGT